MPLCLRAMAWTFAERGLRNWSNASCLAPFPCYAGLAILP